MRTSYALLCAVLLIGAAFASDNIGKQKSQQLRKLAQESPNGIIKLSAADFYKYVMDFPRPYDFVIFFTANKCQFCDEMQAEFTKTAEFYKAAGALNPYKDEGKQLRSVYFGIIVFTEDTRQVFSDLEFRNAPHIVHFQPKVAILSNEERSSYLKRFRWSITHTDGHVTTHKMLEYVNKHTGRDVQYQPSLSDALTVIGYLLGAAATLVFIFIAFKPIFLNTKLWFVGSIAIYVICSAGLVYNIIHNIPMTSTRQDGQIEWFSSQNRQQLGAEGFIMAGLFAIIGLLIISWRRIYKWFDDDMLVAVSYAFIFLTLWALVYFIEDVYKKKGWYNPRFYPPENYIQGPLMKDQGNSI